MIRFAALAKRLVADGHEVIVISKDEARARRIFPSLSQIVSAPRVKLPPQPRIPNPRTLAGLAWNLGYNDKPVIQSVVDQWIRLIAGFQPDLVISDFGIGAAVAALSLGCKHVRIGTGFECPPPMDPMAQLKMATSADGHSESDWHAEFICDSINSATLFSDSQKIASLAELSGGPQSTLLATVSEFDHYDRDGDFEYLGIWQSHHGQAIRWKNIGSLKAFAYLKPHPHLKYLFAELARCGVEVALVMDGPCPVDQITSPLIIPQPSHVALDDVARSCHFAITNGNHGTTLELLSLAVPVLALPLYIEQRGTAERLRSHGFGHNGKLDTNASCAQAVLQMLFSDCRPACARFAATYRDTFNRPAIDKAHKRLKTLLTE